MKRTLKLASITAVAIAVLIACLIVLPGQAQAATSGKFTYEIEDGGAVITDYDNAATGAVTIPGTLGGYPVVSIDDYAFEHCNSITKVTIPKGVTYIGWSAFYSCDSLVDVVIPEGVTTIKGGAFGACPCIVHITLPGSATEIVSTAFDQCTSLKGIWITGTNPNYSHDSKGFWYNKDKTELIRVPMAYAGAYTVPSTVKVISDSAAYNCDALTQVTIPGSVTTIESFAFFGCESLKTVTIKDGLKTIENYAFSSNPNLPNITIPATVSTIEPGAFGYCSRMSWISVNSANPYYCTDSLGVLYNKNKTVLVEAPTTLSGKYTIPSTVKTIEKMAFQYCRNLTAVTIPSSVTTIGNDAFYGCANLYQVSVPASVTTFGNYIFGGCDNLSSVTLANGIKEVPNGMFSDCSSLVHIKLPNSIQTIGSNAFSYCDELTGISLPASVTSIGDYAFNYCEKLTNITIPLSVKEIGYNSFKYCEALTNVYYASTKANWSKITKDTGNTDLTGATIKYSSIFTSQPMSVIQGHNTKAKFSVVAKGSGLKYQWQYRKSATGKWADTGAYGYNTANLTVAATAEKSGYQYRCVVTNSKGVKNYTAAATMYVVKAQVVWQPYDQTVAVGNIAKFSVTAQGIGLRYQWQYKAPGKAWENTGSNGNKTPNLYIATNKNHNGYQYRCKITDNYGNVFYTKIVNLKIVSLQITSNPYTRYARMGGTAKFSVKATGTGLKYQWQYRTSSTGKWANASATGNNTANVTIPATMSRNGYQYRCKVTDSTGKSVFSSVATLNVVVLKINTQPVNRTVKAGATANFSVKATGTGLTFQWQYRTSANDYWHDASATGNKTANLKVPATMAKNGYQYRCCIMDKWGNYIYTAIVNLKVTR